MAWQNPDVHARTPELAQLVKTKYPKLKAESEHALSLFDKAYDFAVSLFDDKQVLSVLDKLKKRKEIRDKDLCGIPAAGLFTLCWARAIEINKPDPKCRENVKILFRYHLLDIGHHCVQGDTHRLFLLYIALHEPDL